MVDSGLIDRVVPQLLSNVDDAILSIVPSTLEVKWAIFSFRADLAPGPDGFG